MKPANARWGAVFFCSFLALYWVVFGLVAFLDPVFVVQMIAPGIGLTCLTYVFTRSYFQLKWVEFAEKGIHIHPLGLKIDAESIESVRLERDFFQNDVIHFQTRHRSFLPLIGASSFGKEVRIAVARS